jgi:uncharacterized membrane protein HdeD (DUF308 family)
LVGEFGNFGELEVFSFDQLRRKAMSAAATPLRIHRSSFGWSVAISIFLIIAGALAIVVPPVAGLAVNIFVAWMLIFSAGGHFVYAWHNRKASGIWWEVLIGVLHAVVGALLLVNPLVGLLSLTLALAIYLFVEALLEIFLSFQLRPLPGTGWLLFDGVVTLILALMIWRTWPSSTEWAIGILVGISMLFSGVSRLMMSLAARRLAHEFA